MWRITPEGRASVKASKGQRSVNNNNSFPRMRIGEQAKVIKSAVETTLAKKAKSEQLVSKEITQARDFVISVFKNLAGKMSATPRTANANSFDSQSFLTSILKKAKKS